MYVIPYATCTSVWSSYTTRTQEECYNRCKNAYACHFRVYSEGQCGTFPSCTFWSTRNDLVYSEILVVDDPNDDTMLEVYPFHSCFSSPSRTLLGFSQTARLYGAESCHELCNSDSRCNFFEIDSSKVCYTFSRCEILNTTTASDGSELSFTWARITSKPTNTPTATPTVKPSYHPTFSPTNSPIDAATFDRLFRLSSDPDLLTEQSTALIAYMFYLTVIPFLLYIAYRQIYRK